MIAELKTERDNLGYSKDPCPICGQRAVDENDKCQACGIQDTWRQPTKELFFHLAENLTRAHQAVSFFENVISDNLEKLYLDMDSWDLFESEHTPEEHARIAKELEDSYDEAIGQLKNINPIFSGKKI